MAKTLTEYKGYPLGVNTDPERTIAQMQDISIRQNCCQIPFYFLAEEKIDKDLLLRAINEEIRRNDSLRMRWIKKGFLMSAVRYHYFLEEYVLDDIPELDFRGKTQEEMEAALAADAAITVKYLKGETFRFKLLHAPDGRDGLYFISTHMNMDVCAMLICIRDLLEVYTALKDGTEMPKPLYPYEEMYKEDQAKFTDPALQEKYLEYFKEYQARFPYVSFYAGFDRMRQLRALRKKKKNPDLRYVDYNLLNNKTTADMKFYKWDKDTVDRMKAFCEQERVTFQALVLMGLRLHLSRWNDRTNDVTFTLLANRRASLKEQRTGGCRVNAMNLRAVIENDLTFREGLKEQNLLLAKALKRSNIGYFTLTRFLQENEHRGPLSSNLSCFVSILPPEAFPPVAGWTLEFFPVKLANFPFIPYFLVQPMGDTGEMSVAIIYQIYKFTEEDIELTYQDLMKALELGMNDPEITMDQIIDQL